MNNNKLPSNRNFALVFFLVFFVVGLWPITNGKEVFIWSIILSIIFLFLGLLNSKLLSPLNKIWMKFGLILGNIISPIIMGIIYFGVVTPTGFFLKIFGKDILNLKTNKSETYWIKKNNLNNDMRNQF